MDNIFKISLHNFKINTIIGILPHERVSPQTIILNLDIFYRKIQKTNNDCIIESEEVLDYAVVHKEILDIFRTNSFGYLEDCIDFIIAFLQQRFKNISQIILEIQKPEILADCVTSVSRSIKND